MRTREGVFSECAPADSLQPALCPASANSSHSQTSGNHCMSMVIVHCVFSHLCGRPQEGVGVWLNVAKSGQGGGGRFSLQFVDVLRG